MDLNAFDLVSAVAELMQDDVFGLWFTKSVSLHLQ